MSSSTTSSVYLHVVEDVVSKMRDEFLSSAAGESALIDLQARWELKMMQGGAINAMADRPAAGRITNAIMPVRDLNVPYEGPEEYETPTAEMLFPPTPLQTPMRTPLPGNVEPIMYQYLPASPTDFPLHDSGSNGDANTGRPNPYMQPPSPWMTQRPSHSVDVNVAYVEGQEEPEHKIPQPNATKDFFVMNGGKRKRESYPPHINPGGYIPQQDEASDIGCDTFPLQGGEGALVDIKKEVAKVRMQLIHGSNIIIPQQDGLQDEYEDGFVNEDYNTPSGHDLHPVIPLPGQGGAEGGDDDDDEPPLNEDDDDDNDELEQGVENQDMESLVLSQFEKRVGSITKHTMFDVIINTLIRERTKNPVTRTKNRWKCMLKGGIMRLNNKDILFNKANGEFEF